MEENPIYYKSTTEPETVKEVLREYLFHLQRPATYLDKECTVEQCPANKCRSIDDMILIVRSIIKDATVYDVIKGILEIKKDAVAEGEGKIATICFCNDVKMPTLRRSTYHKSYYPSKFSVIRNAWPESTNQNSVVKN